jgi:hypothetical protein
MISNDQVQIIRLIKLKKNDGKGDGIIKKGLHDNMDGREDIYKEQNKKSQVGPKGGIGNRSRDKRKGQNKKL